MMTAAIGKPIASAPPIINANAESGFSAYCNSCEDMSLLHRAPTGVARCPRINDQENSRRDKVLMTFKKGLALTPSEAGRLWLIKGYRNHTSVSPAIVIEGTLATPVAHRTTGHRSHRKLWCRPTRPRASSPGDRDIRRPCRRRRPARARPCRVPGFR